MKPCQRVSLQRSARCGAGPGSVVMAFVDLPRSFTFPLPSPLLFTSSLFPCPPLQATFSIRTKLWHPNFFFICRRVWLSILDTFSFLFPSLTSLFFFLPRDCTAVRMEDECARGMHCAGFCSCGPRTQCARDQTCLPSALRVAVLLILVHVSADCCPFPTATPASHRPDRLCSPRRRVTVTRRPGSVLARVPRGLLQSHHSVCHCC